MASKRNLKKYISTMVDEVLDECVYIQDFNPSKLEATEEMIEEILDFEEEILHKIHVAKTKKDFAPIRAIIDKTEDEFIEKMNKI